MALRSDDKFIVVKTTGGDKPEEVPLSELNTFISTEEDSRIKALETSVDTAETGLLDRATALETTVDTATTGLVDRVGALEATAQTAAAGTPVTPVAASAVLTAADTLADGNTATVNDVTYTFRTALTTNPATVPNEVLIGVSKEASMINLKKAINGEATEGTNYSTDTEQPTDVTATVDGAVVTCTATTAGTAGNAYVKAAVGDNIDWDGTGGTFSNGVNGTPGVAGAMLYETGKLWISTDKSTTAVSHWECATLT